jgi:hypothetical protein
MQSSGNSALGAIGALDRVPTEKELVITLRSKT